MLHPGMGKAKEEEAVMGRQGKISNNKKKGVANLSEELNNYNGATFNEGNGGCKPSKENSRKKRDKREGEVSTDICDEHINLENFVEVDDDHLKVERKKKKKKKRKLDIVEDNAQLDNESDMRGDGGDIKATKQKKRLKADRVKDNEYTSS